jgi:hypothetical protein
MIHRIGPTPSYHPPYNASPPSRGRPAPVAARRTPVGQAHQHELSGLKHAYQQRVRKLQGDNRFKRSRAAADWALKPVRGAGLFVGLPLVHHLGAFLPIGLPIPRIDPREGRDPARLRVHLFQEETSRHTSRKVVKELRRRSIISDTRHFVRRPSRDELLEIQGKYRLTDEATAKVGWALETFEQITREAHHEAPSVWDHALDV